VTKDDDEAATPQASGEVVRLTWDGHLISAPPGTNQCAAMVGQPHPTDLVHRLFAPEYPSAMIQLMTGCGRRAHYFVRPDENREVDCPDCLRED
jgi:hypothetical protein